MLKSNTLEEIANNHDKSVVLTIIRWHFQSGFTVIPGSTNPDHIKEDFVFDEKQKDYVIAMDRHGKPAYESNQLMLREKGHPIIEARSENVSDAYLNCLQRLGISYIFAGKDDIVCRVCMEKLYRLFHIRKLMIAGGGNIDFVFSDCGMMDELPLVLSPTADGENLVTVIERNEKSVHPSLSFSLLDVKNMGNDTIWLRYQLKNKDGTFQGGRI